MIWRTLKRAHRCQQSPESLDKCRFYHSPDPPKSPLRRGTLTPPVPPFLRGAPGRSRFNSQQSLTGFDLKLTPMGSAVSLHLTKMEYAVVVQWRSDISML